MLSLAKPPREKGTISADNAVSCTDIVFQILLCLPLKSLLVCKTVSKQWLTIIIDPHFIRERHRIRRRNRLMVPGLFLEKDLWSSVNRDREYHYICIDGNVTTSYVPFQTLNFAGEDIKMVASCNGLLLCSNYYSVGYSIYYIYNPFTKQYKILPLSIRPSLIHPTGRYKMCLQDTELAFHPLKSLYYKVICIWGDPYGSATKRIEIYSSETSSWRICVKAYTFPGVFYKSCALWNGSLNWVTNKGSLFYFDISREAVGEVLSPWKKDGSYWCSTDSNYFLDVYGDHLLLLLINLDIPTCFNVFEMDTNYTGWIMKYKVDMDGLKGSYPELGRGSCSWRVIFIDEVDEFSPKFIIQINDRGVVISYDSQQNSCTELYDVPEWKGRRWLPVVHKYVESLACV